MNNIEIRVKALELSMQVFMDILHSNPSLLLDGEQHKELKAEEFVIEHSKSFEKYLKEAL